MLPTKLELGGGSTNLKLGGGPTNLGESLGGSSDDDGMKDRWAVYLKRLEQEDPEEHRLLLEELEQVTESASSKMDIKTSGDSNGDGLQMPGEDGGAEFDPVMPGGKQKLGKEGVVEQHESQRVEAVPAFVIKTSREDGKKVFINVCQSDLLQKMGPKKTLMEDGTEQEGMNIPVSLGPEREETDKAGSACVVYDIIVHPEVVTNAHKDETGASRTFLCELALNYVEQKHKCKVDYRFKLPKMKYKGNDGKPLVQFIRKQHKPVIEEVQADNSNNSTKSGGSNIKNKQKNAAGPTTPAVRVESAKYSLERVMDDGTTTPCEAVLSDSSRPSDAPMGVALRLRIQIPSGPRQAIDAASLMNDVHVDVAPECIVVKASQIFKTLELFLPCAVQEHNCTARLLVDQQTLEITMPVAPFAHSQLGADPGSRPWLLAQALRDGTEGPELARPETDGNELDPKADGREKEKKEEENENDAQLIDETLDVLPEDKFHKYDMVSQHIKDERERQRKEKALENEAKEKVKLLAEANEKAAKEEEAMAELVQQARTKLDTEVNPAAVDGLSLSLAGEDDMELM